MQDSPDEPTFVSVDALGRHWIECPSCQGDGIIDDGSCACGDDTCCCAEPEPPDCRTCQGNGRIQISKETVNAG